MFNTIKFQQTAKVVCTTSEFDTKSESDLKLLAAHVQKPLVLMNQVHSDKLVSVEDGSIEKHINFIPAVDAVYTTSNNLALCVQSADCLPVLLCDQDQTFIAAAHCGWRGAAQQILHNLIEGLTNKFKIDSSNFHAFLGPCICVNCYEVGPEFLNYSQLACATYKTNLNKKLNFDLRKCVVNQLTAKGIKHMTHQLGCGVCSTSYHSHRKDKTTQRMCSCIFC